MKRLSLYLFLILFTLQTSSWADDIRDFQIEGMSIGDSALDYFSEEEINSGRKLNYEESDFYKIEIRNNKFEIYEIVGFYFKAYDQRYEIFGISGSTLITKSFKKCLADKEKIEKEISLIFEKSRRFDHGTLNPAWDKKTKFNQVEFYLENYDSVVITCYEWSKEGEEKENWQDNISIELYSKELSDFIRKDTAAN